ncbi:YihY/virulence factor BrkB family protein [Euzebya rosea]|uniref:YihY/virulence factor BrkB family protein n=1 Tax=Euzebya rosea TaxID=2052804 RepID=UPI000D3ED6F9|nr:YihY/virulence factor BrkB family protein [Euzebya rosea]
MAGTTAQALDERSWWKLGGDGWRTVLRNTGQEFKADEVSNLAAVVTLRIVLALVPSLIAAVAIAAQVVSTADIEAMVAAAGDLIPGSARDFVEDALQTALENLKEDGTVALIISIGAGLFAASGAAAALINALNKAYDRKEDRGFVGLRLTSLGVIGALALALIGMFVAIVFGPTLLELVLPQEVLDSPLRLLIGLGRYVAAITILMLFFGFAFWFGPNRDRPRLRFLTPGAVLGVGGWLLLSFLFGLYVSFSQSYAATYGAFAGVIVLLVWLNYSFTVLLMGAELDHEIERYLTADATAGGDTGPDPTPAPALDAVTADMPRHPGLVGTRHGSSVGTTQRDQGDDEPSDGGLVVPPLQGVAAATPGAALAARAWRRFLR